MLSNKWTFSLTSLVVMLAFAFVASSAMAGEFGISLGVGNTDNTADADVSYADGVQAARAATTIRIKTDKVVNAVASTATNPDPTDPDLVNSDFTVIAYNEFGGTETVPDTALGEVTAIATNPDGKNFTMTLGALGTDVDKSVWFL